MRKALAIKESDIKEALESLKKVSDLGAKSELMMVLREVDKSKLNDAERAAFLLQVGKAKERRFLGKDDTFRKLYEKMMSEPEHRAVSEVPKEDSPVRYNKKAMAEYFRKKVQAAEINEEILKQELIRQGETEQGLERLLGDLSAKNDEYFKKLYKDYRAKDPKELAKLFLKEQKEKHKIKADSKLEMKEKLEEQKVKLQDDVLKLLQRGRNQLSKQSPKREQTQQEEAIREAPINRGGATRPDFENMGRFDLDGIAHDPNYDFDAMWDKLLGLAKQNLIEKNLLTGLKKKIDKIKQLEESVEEEDGFEFEDEGTEDPRVPRFQPDKPIIYPSKEVAIKNFTNEVFNIIVDEFVTPGLSAGTGMGLLEAVWMGLRKVKGQMKPEDFDEAMIIVWEQIRKMEFHWLASAAGSSLAKEPLRLPPPQHLKDAVEEISHICQKYLDFCLKVSKQNGPNLRARLEEIAEKIGPQNFYEVLKAAFEKSKVIEDRVFPQWLGTKIDTKKMLRG